MQPLRKAVPLRLLPDRVGEHGVSYHFNNEACPGLALPSHCPGTVIPPFSSVVTILTIG
jgi:hypothetical protein